MLCGHVSSNKQFILCNLTLYIQLNRNNGYIFLFQVSHLDDTMVLFLASLPQNEYEIGVKIFQKFEICDIKDQGFSRTQ